MRTIKNKKVVKKVVKKKSVKNKSVLFSDLLIIKDSIKKIGGYDRFAKALLIYKQLFVRK